MSRIVDHADPRLGLRLARAAPADVATRVAIRLLEDALAPVGSGLLAAPAVGVPVSLIALRDADATSFLLNPQLRALGPLSEVIGETSPLTGPVRRNTRRARSLVVEATDMAGLPHTVELSEHLALQAQQAFDLLHGQVPLDWLTPWHRLWLAEADPARRALFDAVAAGMFGHPADPSAESPARTCLRFGDSDTLELRLAADDPEPMAALQASNPLRPLRPHHRHLLALHAVLPELRHALFADPAATGLMLAVLLGFPGVACHLLNRPGGWPDAAFATLGLDRVLRRHETAADGFRGLAAGPSAVEAIVFDRIAAAPGAEPDVPALRSLAQVLSGPSGALLWAVPAVDPAVEDRLQATFPTVHAVLCGDCVIYAAFKTAPDPGTARARLVARAGRTGARHLTEVLERPWLHLRKDGQRVRL